MPDNHLDNLGMKCIEFFLGFVDDSVFVPQRGEAERAIHGSERDTEFVGVVKEKNGIRRKEIRA